MKSVLFRSLLAAATLLLATVLPNWRQPHRRFTSYLYEVTGGPEKLIATGKAIADDAGLRQ